MVILDYNASGHPKTNTSLQIIPENQVLSDIICTTLINQMLI
jgi:hypothetical protein